MENIAKRRMKMENIAKRASTTISKAQAEAIDKYLCPIIQLEDACLSEDETISNTVIFDDGKQMDIKCCGVQFDPDSDNSAWTEAVLFDENGSELTHSDVSDEYVGEWELEYDGITYVGVIEIASSWEKTDDMQYLRYLGNRTFELIEANYCEDKYVISEAEVIDLAEYVNPDGTYTKEASSIIASYYHNDESFNSSWLDKYMRDQVLAEMIYESTSHFLILDDYGFVSEEDAERILLHYTKTGEYLDLDAAQEGEMPNPVG